MFSTDIISQIAVNVKVSIDFSDKGSEPNPKKPKPEREDGNNQFVKWQQHKRDAVEMAKRLAAVGLNKRAGRMLMCGNEIVFNKCEDCGHVHIVSARLCRDRLCPTCAWRLSLRRYATMSKIINRCISEFPTAKYSLVTLTCRNCDSSILSDALNAMAKAWHYCMSQRWVRAGEIIGWARSTEVTYNPETKTLHPHYHVLIMHEQKNIGEKLIEEWLIQCKNHSLIAVSAAQHVDAIATNQNDAGDSLAKAVCEVYKYTVKSSDSLKMPLPALRDLAFGLSSKRLVSFGGIIKKFAAEENAEIDDMGDENNPLNICTYCGSKKLDEIILTWSLRGNKYLCSCTDDVALDDELQEIINKAVEIRDKNN